MKPARVLCELWIDELKKHLPENLMHGTTLNLSMMNKHTTDHQSSFCNHQSFFELLANAARRLGAYLAAALFSSNICLALSSRP